MKKILVLIFGFCLVLSGMLFSGCGDPYANVYLSSTKSQIQLAVGETKIFEVQIENYFAEMSSRMSANSDGEFARIVDIDYQSNGKAFISIEGLKVGNGAVRVSTYEGSKSVSLNVEVYQKVTGFELKTNPYVVKESGFELVLKNANFFDFEPVNSTETPIKYTYSNLSENLEIKKIITVEENDQIKIALLTAENETIFITEDYFRLSATLTEYPEINPIEDFLVDIIEPIQIGDLNIIKKGYDTENYLNGENIEKVEENGEITLISNKRENSYIELELQVQTANVLIELSSSKSVLSPILVSENDFDYTSSNSYFFSIQARDLGYDTLTIKAFYENYDEYLVEKSFAINTLIMPTNIVVNDLSMFETPVILYDHNYGNETEYKLTVAVNSLDSLFESISFDVMTFADETYTNLENWSQYLFIKEKGITKTTNFQIPYSSFSGNVLSNSITLLGNVQYQGTIFIRLTLNSNLISEGSVVFYIPIEIKKGAFGFEVESQYANGIVLDLNEEPQYFDALLIDDPASYIGKMAFNYLSTASLYFKVEQSAFGSLQIKLTPLAIGQGEVNLILPNGKFVKIKIIVKQSLTDANLTLLNSNYISKITTDDNNNLTSFAIKYYLEPDSKDTVKTYLKLLTNPSTANLFSASYTIEQEESNISFDVNTYEILINKTGSAILNIKLQLLRVEDFEIATTENEINFSVEILIYSPLNSFEFEQNSTSVSNIEIYRSSDVGFIYIQQNYSQIELDLVATLLNGTQIENIFTYFSSNEDFAITKSSQNTYTFVADDNFGLSGTMLNFGTYAISGNKLTLNCNDVFAKTNISFWIAISIKQYNITITKVLNIKILEYTPLYSVGFYNYQEEIYLSETSPSYTFSTFLDPNADCQEFRAFFKSRTGGGDDLINVIVRNDFKQVKIEYNKNKGTGYGTLYFVPLTSYTSQDTYSYFTSLTVYVSDGSDIDNPMPINTAQEFKQAMLNAQTSTAKHFKITTTLDFANVNLSGIGEFNGTITGANSSAKLTNITINTVYTTGDNSYYGIFQKLGANAVIKNLVFEGKILIDINSSNNFAIGLLAGINLGTVQNCKFLLNASSILIKDTANATSTKNIFVGSIVGVNNGTIKNIVDLENNTFNHTLLNHNGLFACEYRGYSNNTAIGGVAGINNGVILRENPNGFVVYNSSVYSAVENILSTGFYTTGGVAGKNNLTEIAIGDYTNSTISDLLVDGTIRAVGYGITTELKIGGKNVGGIVGTNNSYINNCTIRTKISGINFVGGIVGNDNTIQGYTGVNTNYQFITNCEVQAIYNGTFAYMITALENLGNIGAIAGNETTFLNEYLYSQNNNNAYYYYTISETNKIFPVAYEYANNKFTKIKYNSDNPYYNLFTFKAVAINVQEITPDYEKGAQKLEVENTIFDNLVCFMFFYQAENTALQSTLNSYNNNREIPFVFENSNSLILTPESTNILSITPEGKINLNGTGLAIVKVTSLLNTTISNFYVYIYVINAFDGFKVFTSNNDLITTNAVLTIYEKRPIELNYQFTHSNIEVRDNYNQIVWAKLVNNTKGSLLTTISGDTQYINITQTGNLLILSVNTVSGLNQNNIIVLSPIFSNSINIVGNVSIPNTELEKFISATNDSVTMLAYAKRGTESIQTNISSTTVEPIDVFTIIVNQKTDYQNDYLNITSTKVGDTSGNNDYFIIKTASGYTFDETNNVYLYNGTNGSFAFQFNYQKYVNTDYAGQYYITFMADNGELINVYVNIETQQVSNIILKSFYNIGTTFDNTMLENNYMASNANNLLLIEVFPNFANYDYIFVRNDAINTQNENIVLFEVVSLDEENQLNFVFGVTYTNGGAKIPRSVLQNFAPNSYGARLYVKYTTTSKAKVDSQAKIVVEAIKTTNNVDTVVYSTSKTITVIIKDNVSFSIVGKEIVSGQNIYLAKGKTYELNLNIYGFTENQMQIEITNSYGLNTNAVAITKQNNKWYLTVNTDVIYTTGEEGYFVKIATYGENTIDGLYYSSGKSYLNIIIVDFVILTSNIDGFDFETENISDYAKNTIIKNATKAVAKVAVGNKYDLEIGFENGLTIEYDTTNANVYNQVVAFQNALKTSGVWQLNATEFGIAGEYDLTKILTTATNISNQYLRVWSSSANTISVSPMKLIDYLLTNYYFNFSAKFEYQNGLPTITSSQSGFSFETDFVLDVYPTSTEENAIPIYTYNDLLIMKENSWYIMMNDIQLESSFIPLNINIAGLNGNGYSIIYPLTLTINNFENVGLFSQVYEKTILKNITIKIKNTSLITIENENAINFGMLAGFNNGVITNCSVFSENYNTFTVIIKGQVANFADNYVAGLVGHNAGYITNSRVEMNLIASANIAGFVGINESKIASSYVKNTSIINKISSTANFTAGFVVKNGISVDTKASITSCYVGRDSSSTTLSSPSTTKFLSSNSEVAGFAYYNYSKISNCYSDIFIRSSSLRSGFVFHNAGTISNAYSTSNFELSGSTAYGFVCNISIGSNRGTITNSFYQKSTNNTTVTNPVNSGVLELTTSQFASTVIFKAFVISSSTNKTEGVWFYPSSNTEALFKIDGVAQKFTYGKLELVSPNLIASTQKKLDLANTTYNQSTGETIYKYYETREADGALLNPYLIYSANNFENYILSNSLSFTNSSMYRIVCDIDYVAEGKLTSNLYKTTFKGVLEGNDMTVAGYVIDTKESLTNGGLFAKIGNGYSNEGCVKNLNIQPKYINMPNTSNVGALAGTLQSGKIYNITVDGFRYEETGLVIIGYNCVGGIVGVANNNFIVKNVTSSVSARASYKSSLVGANLGIYSSTNTTQISYSGTIVGVTDNSGTISYVSTTNNVASMAEIAGLMFGKIGTNVKVSEINLTINNEQFVNASSYGGIIAGENNGQITNVNISGTASQNFFKTSPIIPLAVGGVVGLNIGGKIETVICNLNFGWLTISPTIVSGLVGEMLGGEIKDSQFDGDINIIADINFATSFSATVGGIVGRIACVPTASISVYASNATLYNCHTYGNINVSTNSIYRINIGGLIGETVNTYTSTTSNTTTKYAYTLNKCTNACNITLDSKMYDGVMYCAVGGLIGGAYADTTKTFAGEIIIYDSVTAVPQTNKYESSSTARFNISIKDYKNNGILYLQYGGILGYGYPVSQLTVVDEVPTKSNSWGLMLQGADKSTTAPSYDGQYDTTDPENIVPILDMKTTIYLILNIYVIEKNYIDNNYWLE
ncbi:MAG: hypothetical protein PHQ62_02970 [Clostridia bacterium]|nr:hypothetical protein [Clostridia bacterium]